VTRPGHAIACHLLAPAIVVCASVGILAQTADHDWSCSALAYTYMVPDERNYVQPTFIADREKLHLEARYGYEDRKTGSAWIGYNISAGETLSFEMTPMLGGVFKTDFDIQRGLLVRVSFKRLDVTTYVFNPDDEPTVVLGLGFQF
jgi:hypothetical protein